jgi:hypothetical protein
MGCIALPFNLYRMIAGFFDWLKEVDDETERIREAYGKDTATRWKRRQYIGCLIQNLVGILLIVILVLIVKHFL